MWNAARRFLVMIDERRRFDRLEFVVTRGRSSVEGLLGEKEDHMRGLGAKARRASVILVACLTLIAVGSACGTAIPTPAGGQGTAPTPTYDPNEFNLTPVIPLPTKEPRSSPEAVPTQNPNDGNEWQFSGSFAPPPTPEQLVQWYGLIVTGTVTQVLPAQWSTPDGKRPTDLAPDAVYSRYAIITPALIKLDAAPLANTLGADVSSGILVVATFGGTVGKDVVQTNDPSQHLQVNQRVLIGLTDHPYPLTSGTARYSTPAGLTWNVGIVYTLTNDGQAIPGIPGAEPVRATDLTDAIISASKNNP